jgi:hypothetical protein
MDQQQQALSGVDSPRSEEQEVEALVRTCLNCGAEMDDFKCKLVCECGYFASCSDYY